MERVNKQRKKVSSWLTLHVKDVKRLIYKKLNAYDIIMTKMAHRNLYTCSVIYYAGFARHCARHGYYTLYQWANFGFNHITEYLIAHTYAHNITWNVNHDYHGWHPNICNMAAKFGHVAVLQWAHKHDCYWDAWTCAKSFFTWSFANIKMIAWTCYNATFNNQQHILKWIYENNSPVCVLKNKKGLNGSG